MRFLGPVLQLRKRLKSGKGTQVARRTEGNAVTLERRRATCKTWENMILKIACKNIKPVSSDERHRSYT